MASNGIRDRVAIVGMGCTKFADWRLSVVSVGSDVMNPVTGSKNSRNSCRSSLTFTKAMPSSSRRNRLNG